MKTMDDRKRDLIVKRSAYGYLCCIALLFFISIVFGKIYGQLLLLTIIPVYNLYYLVMYILVCRGYRDKWRRIGAFGFGSRTTLTGLLYNLSLFVLLLTLLFLFRPAP